MLLDGLAGLQFIFDGKFKHFTAILKAHFSFYTLLFKTLKKRKQVTLPNYFKTKSIVYSYFIMNNKKF